MDYTLGKSTKIPFLGDTDILNLDWDDNCMDVHICILIHIYIFMYIIHMYTPTYTLKCTYYIYILR